jgi:hypothetical protein
MTTSTDAAELEQFDRAWLANETTPRARAAFALAGLTRLGEYPVPVERFAAVMGTPVDQAVALAGEMIRVEEGLAYMVASLGTTIHRRITIGDREFGVEGCAVGLFGFAAVLDVPFRVDDTCAATGVPIRVDFVPEGFEHVDPPETVVAMTSPAYAETFQQIALGEAIEGLCSQMPFFSSPTAARDWLDAHPSGRIFSVAEMFQRPSFTAFQALRSLIHQRRQE